MTLKKDLLLSRLIHSFEKKYRSTKRNGVYKFFRDKNTILSYYYTNSTTHLALMKTWQKIILTPFSITD